MKEKTWFLTVSVSAMIFLLILAGINFWTDPFFHYRRPGEELSYSVAKWEYVNDGIIRNFDFDALIAGPCMTTGFKIGQAENLFHRKFVRTTYLGEGFYWIGQDIRTAIATHDSLDLVIWSVDPIWYVTDKNFIGVDSYPEYLLNDNVFDDVNYLLNNDVLFEQTLPELIRTIKGEEALVFDDFAKPEEGGRDKVLARYKRNEGVEKEVTEAETEEMKETLRDNISANIVSVIEENPDITFYLFISPLSICWWDEINQYGSAVLARRIELEQIVLEMLLPYENVRFFSFEDEYDVVCNLDLYSDTIHYTGEVNDRMLEDMYEGRHLLTEDNYLEYLDQIRNFYLNYEYDRLFEDGTSSSGLE